jgi:UDP-GlcNAc:undecaprenyl-phosphate/decaprenyl-phosphate GlcNAc-1-phosphate transferase
MRLVGMLPYLLFALLCGGLAAAITWAMARRAVLVDIPNARSSHVRPTPRGGGLGIVVAFAAGLIVLAGAGTAGLDQPGVIGFAAGAAIMAIAGLADDIRTMSFATKLAAQIVAGLIAMAAGIVITVIYIPGIGPVELGGFGYILTLLWLVGLTNAYNFMDGLDGLAGGTAVIAGGFLCVVAVLLGEPVVAVLALLLAATSAGFLALNFPPARIFMGDVGSQFLGFAFAAMGVLLAQADTTGTIVLIVPLLLFHFLFDTTFTALRRWRRGENLAAAHRSHLYQLLNQSGLSHRQVAGAHYLMAIFQGLLALWIVGAAPSDRWLVFLALLAGQTAYAAVSLRLYSVKNNSVTP